MNASDRKKLELLNNVTSWNGFEGFGKALNQICDMVLTETDPEYWEEGMQGKIQSLKLIANDFVEFEKVKS